MLKYNSKGTSPRIMHTLFLRFLSAAFVFMSLCVSANFFVYSSSPIFFRITSATSPAIVHSSSASANHEVGKIERIGAWKINDYSSRSK